MSGLSMLAEPEAMADMASGQVAVAAAQAPVVKWEVTRAHSKAGTYMRHWLPSEDELLFEVVAKNMGPLPAKTEPVDEDKPLDKKSNNPDGPSVHLQMKAVSWKPVAAAMAHLKPPPNARGCQVRGARGAILSCRRLPSIAIPCMK